MIERPGFDVGCFMLDCSFARTSLNGLVMNRVIRVMLCDSSCVVAILEDVLGAKGVDDGWKCRLGAASLQESSCFNVDRSVI